MLKAKRKQKAKLALFALVLLAVVAVVAWFLRSHTIAVLQPHGPIGNKERQLMMYAALLGVLVILPVYAMTFAIAMKYRENNPKKAKYKPDFDHHRGIEFIWWAVPFAIILVLAVLTWQSSHELDPYKPLAATSHKPITVEVVSLDWKWLFIYPEQGVASVNFVQFPKGTPVNFEVTSDSVMNSFWIPQLGGQIYSMPGMSTQLHLQADEIGDYAGSSANISGKGFSGMTFTARASSQKDFDAWVQHAKAMPNRLDFDAYNKLARPSERNAVTYYSSVQNELYDTIVMKYMTPIQGANTQ